MPVHRNRLANAKNEFQGDYKKVLCVCSAGLLRSPTAALVLSGYPWDFNTRACGMEPEYALIPIDEALIHWADEIVCMTTYQELQLREMTNKPIVCLHIDDNYSYRDPELITLIGTNYERNKA